MSRTRLATAVTRSAGLLVVLATAFALLRSGGWTLALVADADPPSTVAHETADAWLPLGEEVWSDRCHGCHAQVTYLPELFVAEGGRMYLVDLLLAGLHGAVEIEGAVRTLRHPPFGDLDDDAIAAVLNLMLVSWGNDEAIPARTTVYTVDEIASARRDAPTPDEVLESRPTGRP